MIRKYFTGFFSIMLIFLNFFSIAEAYSTEQLNNCIEGIINWKKLNNGSDSEGFLINNTFLEAAGTTAGDWFPIGIGRYGYKDDYEGYLAVIKEVVSKRYTKTGKLSPSKATEWHRISLAVLAMGGDPANIESDGNIINLIADGTYNRGKTAPLGKQGINGWIWGLIALDSLRFPVPVGAYNTRDDIIVEILRKQLPDGGFALSGNLSDPDISAMALLALSPYYNSEQEYSYKNLNMEVTKTVRQVADEALMTLSAIQSADGDYYSWGTPNAESTVQVLTALCSMGIDPEADPRFIKNGKTVLDGIMKYKMPDNGFAHSYSFDENNPSAVPNKSNSMATEQTLCGLAAYYRLKNNLRSFYDFRPEMSAELKEKINGLKSKIEKPDANGLNTLMAEYNEIPASERSYVTNYYKLSNAVKIANNQTVVTAAPSAAKPQTGKTTEKIDIDQNFETGETKDEYKINNPENQPEEVLNINENQSVIFNGEDYKELSGLNENLTTEHYVTVLKLLNKAEKSEDFAEKALIIEDLNRKKQIITDIQTEIDSINEDTLKYLYPFDKISLRDRKKVNEIVDRYNSLSDYDKQKIMRVDDILKTKTQVDNLLRAVIIWSFVIFAIILLSAVTALRIKKRRKQKLLDTMQLGESFYEDIKA